MLDHNMFKSEECIDQTLQDLVTVAKCWNKAMNEFLRENRGYHDTPINAKLTAPTPEKNGNHLRYHKRLNTNSRT